MFATPMEYTRALTKLKLKTYGDRSFSIAGPTLWNKLPSDIRLFESVDIFKQKLKTHFFKQAFLLVIFFFHIGWSVPF